MIPQRWRQWIGLAGLFMVGWVVPGAARDWIKLETDEFTLMSDARESEVRRFARDFAAYRHALRTMVGRPGVRSPRGILILHARRKDFLAYTRKESSSGRFRSFSASAGVDGRAVTTLTLEGDMARVLDTAVEFDTMWTMKQWGWALPTWMDQGTGKVFSTVRVNPHTGEVEVGEKVDGARGFRAMHFLDWERFFEVGVGSEEYRSARHGGAYHSQAWALMHWILLRDEAGPENFKRLAEMLSSRDWLEAVVEVGGVPEDQLRRTLVKHIGGNPPRRSFPFDAAAVEAEFVISPLAEAELLSYQSAIAAVQGRETEADRLFFRADQLDSDLPAVIEAEARWNLRHNDRAAAVDAYRRAVERGTDNAHAYLVSADWRLDRAGGGVDHAGGGIPVVLEPARAEVEAALALDPGMGWAYALLGRIAFVEPEPNPSHLSVLSRRVGDDRWGTRARYYRGLLLQRLGRIAEARADMEILARHPEASTRTRRSAERNLDQWEANALIEAVNALADAHDYEAAHAQMTAFLEENPDSPAVGDVQRLQAGVEQRRVQHLQAEFNEEREALQAMLRQKDYEGAWARVRELRDATASDSLRTGYGRMERQIAGVALAARVTAAREAQDWAAVAAAADEFLATQPEGHGARANVVAARAEAIAALGDA